MRAQQRVAQGRTALRSVFSINDSPARWPVATKAALAGGIPLAVGTMLGRPELGLTAGMGGFAVLYGPTTAGRFRIRLLLVVAAALVGSLALGVVSASVPVLFGPALVLVSVVAATLCVTLKVGPPGAYFFILVLGVGNYLVAHVGHAGGELIGAAACGGLVALFVGMSDLLLDRHRPERVAVEAAARAVAAFEVSEHDLPAARARASVALHHAWTTLRDATGLRSGALRGVRQRLAEDLVGVHDRHLTRLATVAGVLAVPPPARGRLRRRGLVPDTDGEVDLAAEDLSVDAEQLRETSLGRPGAAHLIRTALHWPSEVLLVGLRVGLATAIAGLLALSLGSDHVYWAVAFAALVLHAGGTRVAQTVRGLQRVLGTMFGLVLFAAIVAVHPSGWWLVPVVMGLQFSVEMLVTRNYAVAVSVITPLALTISLGGRFGANTEGLVADRALDTLIGVAVALCVLWLTGLGSTVRILRAHLRRLLEGIEQVMADLAAGRVDGAREQEHRRVLYHHLLEGEAITARAKVDDPEGVTAHLPLARAVTQLGYLVLGSSWHPDLRHARDLFGQARADLAPLLSAPPGRPGPESLEAELAALSAQITGWQAYSEGDDRRPGAGL